MSAKHIFDREAMFQMMLGAEDALFSGPVQDAGRDPLELPHRVLRFIDGTPPLLHLLTSPATAGTK